MCCNAGIRNRGHIALKWMARPRERLDHAPLRPAHDAPGGQRDVQSAILVSSAQSPMRSVMRCDQGRFQGQKRPKRTAVRITFAPATRHCEPSVRFHAHGACSPSLFDAAGDVDRDAKTALNLRLLGRVTHQQQFAFDSVEFWLDCLIWLKDSLWRTSWGWSVVVRLWSV